MDMKLKDRFLSLWNKYFNRAELPIAYWYADDPGDAIVMKEGEGPRCIIGGLVKVRQGASRAYDVDAVGCPGGKRYLGFSPDLMPDFEYFLSCGIPGKMEGERYKQSPELVREAMADWPAFEAPAKYIVFKRWDNLSGADNPEVVVVFAQPDVLSGLFTLASFDEKEGAMNVTPFGSGCSSIVQYPYLETGKERPGTVIGMFDVSARPYVPDDVLTFAAPMSKFLRMADNMEESFLITGSWRQVQKRIK
jgi:uncharacterized protein (DUF169 family)